MDCNNVYKIEWIYMLINIYGNLLGFELCCNLVFVDKDLWEHSLVKIWIMFWKEKWNFLVEKKECMENNGNLLGKNIVVIRSQKTLLCCVFEKMLEIFFWGTYYT